MIWGLFLVMAMFNGPAPKTQKHPCPPGCQSQITALQKEVNTLKTTTPRLSSFAMKPTGGATPQHTRHSLADEWANILLVQVAACGKAGTIPFNGDLTIGPPQAVPQPTATMAANCEGQGVNLGFYIDPVDRAFQVLTNVPVPVSVDVTLVLAK